MPPIDVTTIAPEAALALSAAAAREDGFESLAEPIRRDLEDPSAGSFDVVAEEGGDAVALAHLVAPDRDGAHAQLGLVVAPPARTPGLVTAVLERALDEAGPSTEVVAWLPGTPAWASEGALAAGFAPQRRLLRMERPLAQLGAPEWPGGVTVRGFATDRDAQAWVALNNRAFAEHPEQGAWTVETLRAREAEPWFEPEGFLLAHRGEELVGFCWTKRHPERIGEIYVIAVDPAHHGHGLGRALVLGGLASLRERGCDVGMLYVDTDQEAAVGLYRSLGFTVVRTDAALVRSAR